MNLLPEDRPWLYALLAKVDLRLHPAIKASALRDGMGSVRWQPLFRWQVTRVGDYLTARLADIPEERRRLKTPQDARLLRNALERVFVGGTDGQNYVGAPHLAVALASIGYLVKSDGRGLDAPEAHCSFKSDFPSGAVERAMRRWSQDEEFGPFASLPGTEVAS